MNEIYIEHGGQPVSGAEMEEAVQSLLSQCSGLKKVLIVPPDYTRCYSFAGEFTKILYRQLAGTAQVDIMPAVGTHMEMSREEKEAFFGTEIPESAYLNHHWQTDTTKLGTVPASFTDEITGGLFPEEVEVEVNHRLVDGGYDLIISIGQVVPHEVVGMANYSKNLFVGLGGRGMINKSHMLSAICGMEKAIGVMNSPARRLYDYAQEHFIDGKIPLVYIQTVTNEDASGQVQLCGVYIGSSRKPFEHACALSQKLNITYLDRPAKKVVAYLDPKELKTTWVGNKGIYRTRMIVADGGELLLLGPGIQAFGENEEMDEMTRTTGYTNTPRILGLYRQGKVFEGKLMSAAHLIHGSSEGRFTITYATKKELMSADEIHGVGYEWADYDEVVKKYDPEKLKEGWNILPDGEEIYFVGRPALGLWKLAEK